MNYELIKIHISHKINSNDSDWNIEKDGRISVDGIIYKPMPWRYDRKMCSLRHLAYEYDAVSDIRSYKATIVESKNEDIYELLYRELDLCQWILNDKIVNIYALENAGKTISVIGKTKKNIIYAIDIGTTLSDESTPVTRHEIVGREGVISDRCVDERIPTMAMYVFEEDKITPTSYMDPDFFVDGLIPEEIFTLEYMTDVISRKEIREEMTKAHHELLESMNCVKVSAKTGDIVTMEVER